LSNGTEFLGKSCTCNDGKAVGNVAVAGASYSGYANSESICKGVTPESFSVPLDLETYSNDPTMIPSHVKPLV
jgi:hypothetical protein